jgi:hypothetical protein
LRRISFIGNTSIKLSGRAIVEGDDTIQRQGCKQHQQEQRIVVCSSLFEGEEDQQRRKEQGHWFFKYQTQSGLSFASVVVLRNTTESWGRQGAAALHISSTKPNSNTLDEHGLFLAKNKTVSI